MNKIKTAQDYHRQGFNCAQSVVAAFSKKYRQDSSGITMKIATGFGGGMGRMGGVCGALTGAFMVLGLKFGMTTPQEIEAKEKTYQLVRKLAKIFKKKNKFLTCKALLGCDISTKRGFKMAKEKGLFKNLCSRYIQDSVIILEEMLKEKKI